MSTQKEKFQLFSRLQEMGFTYEESVALRRIEITLRRWAEAECNAEIQRDESGKPFRHWENVFHSQKHPIADREAGALKRLKAIVDARNKREEGSEFMAANAQDHIIPYHQTDPRGCALYLVKRSDIPEDFAVVWCGDGYSIARRKAFDGEGKPAYSCRFKTAAEAQTFAEYNALSSHYNRGLAVCA